MNFDNNISILSHHINDPLPPTPPPNQSYSTLDDNNNNKQLSGLSLKQQVMLNQFMSITGCNYEQSIQVLASSNWQYQSALSLFFDEFSIINNKQSPLVPCSTPVTPPNLDFLEKAFSKLNPSSNTVNSLNTQSSVAITANSYADSTNSNLTILNGSKLVTSMPMQMPAHNKYF